MKYIFIAFQSSVHNNMIHTDLCDSASDSTSEQTLNIQKHWTTP